MIGRRLGNFEILREIGRGGMGVVYRARQVSLDRVVALKVLPPDLATDGKAAERFEREARAMARMSHPNVVDVIEVGEDDGVHFFAMQLVDGEPLDDTIRCEGALDWERVAGIGAEVAEALQHAHQSGVIHRDIKPGNIMIDRAGHAIVTDFGIAKALVDDGGAMTALTQGPIGSPAYMSPEALRGNPVDGRADLYGLGVVLYEMATGRVPFSATTPYQVATQHLTQPPPSPRCLRDDIPVWLETAILRALAKEPADRFASAAEMAAALRGTEASTPPLTPHAVPGTALDHTSDTSGIGPIPSQQAARRLSSTAWAIAGMGVALMALAAVVFFTGAGRPSSVPVPQVVGGDITAAMQELAAVQLIGTKTTETHDDSPPGTVISQFPAAVTEASPGSSIELIVSLGPDLSAVGADIQRLYDAVAGILVAHEASNAPWDAWRKAHGNSSDSWHSYVLQNYGDLVARDQKLISDYRECAGEARALAVPASAPASFAKMLDIIARGCDAGADRCERSAQLIEEEFSRGTDPSWNDRVYVDAKTRHEALLGTTGSVGGEARSCYDKSFCPELQRLMQQ